MAESDPSGSSDIHKAAPALPGLDLKGLAARDIRPAAGLPPVHLWNPPFCGAIDMVIRRDGTWTYLGTPITRPAMVRLFSTILRREPDGSFVLVTPVERVGIMVEDAPFVAVSMARVETPDGPLVTFITNVGDEVPLDGTHPLAMEPGLGEEAATPYVEVRAGLMARIARPVYYELVDLGEDRDGLWGIASGGGFHVLGPTP